MNKRAWIVLLSLVSSEALADDVPMTPAPAAPVAPAPTAPVAPAPIVPAAQTTYSPWGSSPFVVGYTPPVVQDRAHRGLTLEIAAGGGTTSRDESAGGGTFAIGLWCTRELALTFRATDVGSFGFVGASVQYYAMPRLWLGGGFGQASELVMDPYGYYSDRITGAGGFGRVGYNVGQSGRHALYLSAEAQGGIIEQRNRVVALFAIGYQLL